MSRPQRRFLALFLVVLVPCAILLGWMARAQPRAPATATDEVARRAPPPVPVVLATSVEKLDTARLEVLGSGLAARSVTVYPAVAGEVVQVGFRAGQRVRKDQVLLRLQDRAQRLAVDLATARLEAARRLMARYESTRGTGAVPGSIIDEAQSGVELAEIALRQAREDLADRVVLAPFAGVVGIAAVEPGDRVDSDTAITTLDDRRTLQVAFALPEVYAARLKIGQTVRVTNPAFAGRDFPGRIDQIDSRIDADSRNLRLRARVPNAEDLLRPGMSFTVQLDLAGARYVAVPELALQWGRDGAYVWTVVDGRAQQVLVRSVRRVDEQILLDGPLPVGAPVVVEGVQRLRAGRTVAAVNPAAAAPAPATAASR
ncbi:MAG: efflux RND transporter periplasmic adaptor subunit [Rhodoferax sp.]|nr:efflux RND transporter periplasmic adaptor subunit [Rhodoferax sp.]